MTRKASRIRKIKDWKIMLSPYAFYFLSFLSGALSALTMAPRDIWPLWFLTWPIFVFCLDTVAFLKKGNPFWVGWMFGFGYFLFSLYWIGFAFLLDPERPFWLLGFAIVFLPSLLALYWGAATYLAFLFWARGQKSQKQPPFRFLILSAFFALAEYCRGHLFLGGFPWNLPGYSLLDLGLAQWARFVGAYGITLFLFLGASFLGLFMRARTCTHARFLALGIFIILCILESVGRLMPYPLAQTPFLFRVVQANIDQSEKWDPQKARSIFETYLRYSMPSQVSSPKVIIWPESAVPFLLEKSPEALHLFSKTLPPNAYLLTGAIREGSGKNKKTDVPDFFNSLLVIPQNGVISPHYDKRFLVPFGEYVPFPALWKHLGVERLVSAPGNFTQGEKQPPLELPGIPSFASLICYEVIFPGEVIPSQTFKRPQWILNITNDGWFGNSAGPFQHLVAARFRAIEEGLPLVRAANTGISALIDPFGKVLAHLPLGKQGVLEAYLPGHLSQTVYNRFGNLGFWFLMLCTLVIGGMGSMIFNRRTTENYNEYA